MKIIQTTQTFSDWFTSLKDKTIKTRIQVRIDRAEQGNYGDYKPVGENVNEMRLHFGAGYRVYFIEHGLEIIILLAGGDKSNQADDIKTALKLARDLKG
jgi:putative addiction module killer protein